MSTPAVVRLHHAMKKVLLVEESKDFFAAAPACCCRCLSKMEERSKQSNKKGCTVSIFSVENPSRSGGACMWQSLLGRAQ